VVQVLLGSLGDDYEIIMKICKNCNGEGIIRIPTRKYVIKPELDPWDYSGYFNGRSYHMRVCKNCNGKGEI
jgi:DnaJ-class molecular chaperone